MKSPKPATDNRIKKYIKSYLWNRTMLNFCGIVAAILKMATGRNFSMSGINSGCWNRTMLNLCSIVAANSAQIHHCPISTTFHMWVDYDVPNWFLTSKNFYQSPFSKWLPQCCTKFLRYYGDHFENGNR
jgi:hypothetical protein